MIVLDASAAVEWLRGSRVPGLAIGRRLASLSQVHVPELFEIEVLNAFRGLERSGSLAGERLATALAGLQDMRAVRWSHRELRSGIWQRRHDMSAYDAAYVALASMLDLPLLTADAKLAAVAGLETVELFGV